MSTVIADAYRINDVNGENIQIINDKIKQFMKDEVYNIVKNNIINEMIQFRLYQAEERNKDITFWQYLEHASIFGNSREFTRFKNMLVDEHSHRTFYHNYIRMIELASEMNLDLHLNKRTGFGFKFYEGHTYYIMLGVSAVKSYFKSKYRSVAGRDFKLYEYWNNTDRPSHITVTDWNKRIDNWDNIVKYYPSQDMNTVYVLPTVLEMQEFSSIYELVPNDFNLLKLMYKEIKYNDFVTEELERQIASGETKSMAKGNKYAKEQIEEGLNSGNLLEMADMAKEYRLQKDMITQDLFSEVFNFSDINK